MKGAIPKELSSNAAEKRQVKKPYIFMIIVVKAKLSSLSITSLKEKKHCSPFSLPHPHHQRRKKKKKGESFPIYLTYFQQCTDIELLQNRKLSF